VPPGGTNEYTRRALALTYFLIREGACVNVAGSNGNAPLHLIMMRNILPDQDHILLERLLWKLVEVLLDAGADPTARNMDGRTLYDLAEAKGPFYKENFLRLVRNSHAHVRVPN